MVEAPLLKWWGRALTRDKATVPLYADGALVLGDSLDIMVQATKAPDDVAVLRPFLDEVRQRLGAGQYLGDGFAASDIIAATVLHGLSPHKDRYQNMGPATRRLWTRPELVQEYEDLMAWRDGLYARHRKA